ncbi:MAG: ABC transporter substrate-binding protein, partial [Planctomycetota bacterium]
IPAALRQREPGSRAVELAPAGTWQVRATPERFLAYQAIEVEIALALGRGDGLVAMFDRAHLRRLQELFYTQLPGIGLDLAGVVELPFAEQLDQELFFGLQADAVLIDPRLPIAFWGWTPNDLARMSRRLAPFVGNFVRYPRDASWGPAYPQYSVDEYARRLAQLFDREPAWQRLQAFRDQAFAGMRALLPPADERPALCVLNIGSDAAQGRFYLVDNSGAGARTRHYRELRLQQAWNATALRLGAFGACDYETLAAIDPAVIIVQWALTSCDGPEDFHARFIAPMRAHPVGRRLRAVQDDLVLPGGTGEQGPLTQLFQAEMLAQQLYPERCGDWSWGRQPERPLFDREQLVAVIGGP